jgi:hypothetical protein
VNEVGGHARLEEAQRKDPTEGSVSPMTTTQRVLSDIEIHDERWHSFVT